MLSDGRGGGYSRSGSGSRDIVLRKGKLNCCFGMKQVERIEGMGGMGRKEESGKDIVVDDRDIDWNWNALAVGNMGPLDRREGRARQGQSQRCSEGSWFQK